ncbi:MAG: tetratricopeptide repeat protein [Chitinophagales bacterium]|nr:tetratricopeptide repeat protein [Chitinophagales bacterium]
MKFLVPFIFFVSSFLSAFSQQTLVYSDSWVAYQKGVELWTEKNFVSARNAFEQTLNQPFTNSTKPELLVQNAHFYIAASAAENNDKDAEQLLNNYILHFYESSNRKQIYYYLGKVHFQNKKYSDAIVSLAKIKDSDLQPEQRNNYTFMLGYSYFTKKKFEEAKPYFKQLLTAEEKYFYPANYYYAFICFYTKDFNAALESFLKIQDSKMYAGVIPYYVAQIYYAQQNYKKVIEYVPTKVNDSGVMYKPELNFLLGQAYFQISDYTKALPLLDAYLSKQSKANKHELYQLAYSQYKTGDYKRAIENFVQLNLLNDTLGQNATYALADCYLKTNQKEKAMTAFQSASNMNFDKEIQKIAQFNYGKLLVETESYSEAVNTLKLFVENNSGSNLYEEANELLATALFQTKNYEAAYQLIESMNLRSPKLNDTYQKLTYFRAVQLYNDGKWEEAETLCDKSLKIVSDKNITAKAFFLKAQTQYQQENYNGAASNFAKSLEFNATYDNTFSPFLVNYNIGYSFFKLKQYKYAAGSFETAVKENSTGLSSTQKEKLLPDAYVRFADCAFVSKQYDEALSAYTKIEGSNWPGAEYALFQKGILLGLKGNNAGKISTMESLITRYSSSRFRDQAYFEIGETYLEDGNYNAAQNAYESLLSKFPASVLAPQAYLKIALVAYNKNKKQEAFDGYKKVVTQFPKTSEAKDALVAMREIAVEIGKTDEYVAMASDYGSISSAAQDSLTWQAAENAFTNGEYNRAITLLSNYITKFPMGYFINEALFARAESYIQNKNFPSASNDLKAVINNKPFKFYERALLKASGIAYFELKDYAEAFSLYEKLLAAASNPANVYSAQLGLLKSADKLNYDAKITEYADLVLQNKQLNETDLVEISYMKGRALYRLQQYDIALPLLNKVAAAAVSEKAAECKYYTCKIAYLNQQYKASLDSCIKLKNKFAAYEYWVVKTFVLMADNYIALGNTFQAKATLESIVNNYHGDAELEKEAAEKLESLRETELNKSKLFQTVPSDSLIMENPNDFK